MHGDAEPEPGARGQGVARCRPTPAPRPAPCGDAGAAVVEPDELGGGHYSSPSFPVSCWSCGDDAERVAVLAVGEELVGRLAPAAEVTVDGEQLLGSRERVGRVVGTLDLGDLDAVDDRAEAGLA